MENNGKNCIFLYKFFTILMLIYFLHNIVIYFIRYKIDMDLLKIFYKSISNGFTFYQLEYSTTYLTECGNYCFEYKDDDFDIKNFSKQFEKTENKNYVNCSTNNLCIETAKCEDIERENYTYNKDDRYFQYEINITKCKNRILFIYQYQYIPT